MIEIRQGDILDAEAEVLVNSVNCVGVMGRGVALAFKKRFPDNFKAYAIACRRGVVVPGEMFIFETGRLWPRLIINFPTKRHWRAKSRMGDIVRGLSSLASHIRERNIRSIALPPLGSGLGGLPWLQVREHVEDALAQLEDVRVLVYEPHGGHEQPARTIAGDPPSMTPGRAALVILMARYLAPGLDPFVTLLEVHKLMYFLQTAGEPLKLRYVKGPYGPYAENLRHVLSRIEGHLVSGSAGGGDLPSREIRLVPGALEEAQEFLRGRRETMDRVRRVEELVEGFEDGFGLELLSTVHWVVSEEGANNLEKIEKHTYGWGDRKRMFTTRQLGIAARVLRERGWCEIDQAAASGR